MGTQHIWPAPSKDKDRVSDFVDARIEAAYKHHGIKRGQMTSIVMREEVEISTIH